MNFEETQNKGYEEPTKSKRGWFACGGVGCILLLLVCGGGIGLSVLFGLPFARTIIEANTLVSSNEKVAAALGSPVTISQPGQRPPDGNKVGLDFPITGPEGSGTMKLDLEWKSWTKWEMTSLTVEVKDGETIDVLNSDEFKMPNIDDGMEGEDMEDGEEEIILEEDVVPAGAADNG
jgi:hypothetical protein